MPNAHEVNPLRVENYLKQLPRDKEVLVYCPGGGLSIMISYYLKSKGFKRVMNLRGGLDGWRKRRSDLYEKYAGQNVTVLEPDKVNLPRKPFLSYFRLHPLYFTYAAPHPRRR